jgi:hypothetical protein
MVQKPNLQEGLSAGTVYWIFFMLGFKLLGYSNDLSIGFGAIAGLAAGVIAAWWSPTEEREKPKKEPEVARFSRIKRLLQREAKSDTDQSETATSKPTERFPEYSIMGIRRRRKRQRRATRRFAWWFRKK